METAEKNRLIEATGLRHVYLHLKSEAVKEEDAIRAYADEAEADLVIMGTHQRHGLSHLLFGSLTENTANHTHVPVLAVPISWMIQKDEATEVLSFCRLD